MAVPSCSVTARVVDINGTVTDGGIPVDATFFGASSASAWSELVAVGRSKQGGTLAERRLFYWCTQFFWRHSNRTYAKCVTALRKAARFGPGLNVGANVNNFQNRSYTPGVPNAVASADPALNSHVDAGIDSTEWIDFGAAGAGAPHIEDFGSDFFGFTAALNASIARTGAN